MRSQVLHRAVIRKKRTPLAMMKHLHREERIDVAIQTLDCSAEGFTHRYAFDFERQLFEVRMLTHVCTPNTRATSNSGITCALSAKGQDVLTGATT